MKGEVYREIRGSMTQFLPLTPVIVKSESQGAFTYDWLEKYLADYGLSIDKVVYDPSRVIQNTFYADYERGIYGELYLKLAYLESVGRTMFDHLAYLSVHGNDHLRNKEWDAYYTEDVPLAMLSFDFSRRFRQINPAQVFDVWCPLYRRMDYANGSWTDEVLDYVFAHAPKREKPEPGKNGLVVVYRGMGEQSRPPEKAISWTTHPGNALWFANHFGRGTHLITGEVAPDDIVAYYPGYTSENEVLVRPGSVKNIDLGDMIAANDENFTRLAAPILHLFIFYGAQAARFYQAEGLFQHHGLGHILRVLLLTLIYCCNCGEPLADCDKSILIYFALLHDVGRTNENTDERHGAASVARIQAQNLRIKDLRLTKKEHQIAELIIEYHCRDDAEGIAAIHGRPGFTRLDKNRMARLYRICKDMDGLDRVRFNGLDPRMLRTPFARRLPLIAGSLLQEKLADYINRVQLSDREFMCMKQILNEKGGRILEVR